MLKCNLAVLLAERKIRISKASADTGISRTTLTSLANNYSQGIQLDTLNKLCLYLQAKPEDFFVYLPFDYSFRISKQADNVFTVEFSFSAKGRTSKATMLAFADPNGVEMELDADFPEENEILKKFLCGLPAVFKTDIEEKIFNAISERQDDVAFLFSWPDEMS